MRISCTKLATMLMEDKEKTMSCFTEGSAARIHLYNGNTEALVHLLRSNCRTVGTRTACHLYFGSTTACIYLARWLVDNNVTIILGENTKNTRLTIAVTNFKAYRWNS